MNQHKNQSQSVPLFYLIFFLILTGSVSAQVNTESLRKSNLKNGFQTSLNVDLGLFAGNSDFLKMTGKLRTDFVSGDHYTFGVMQYQRGIQDQNVFVNKAFIHIRDIHKLSRIFRWEWFIQKEFNEFIRLKDRNLIGAGLRTAAWASNFKTKNLPQSLQFYLGTGFMWENEKINTTPVTETWIIRSTNYFNLSWKIDKRVNLGMVTYYQVDLKNLNDYRILSQTGFVFYITPAVSFQTTLNFRYDNEPPPRIKEYDLELKNGIQVAF